MKPDFKATLAQAFERGHLEVPKPDEHWLVFNAHPLPADPLVGATAHYEQGFRPTYLALQESGADVVPRIADDIRCDHAIVLAGRVRAVNEANFARAWQVTGEGGRIIVAGNKTAGIASLRKWVGEHTPVIDSFAKHHAVCFWCERTDEPEADIGDGSAGPQFASGEIDKGSALLAEHFDDRIFGKVADLGAGDGYLTAELLARSSRLASIDLIEAEWAVLELAKQKLADASVSLSFHWLDVTTELQKKPLDWVIMNPPFHHGLHGDRKPDPNLGRTFIAKAASTLVQGGRLLMVANRNLAYERTLETCFRKVTVREECDGYKVIEAMR